MDGCWAFWKLGCVIDWEAWAAIGSLLAVITAVSVSLFTARQARAAKRQENAIILAQLYGEAKKILFTSEWCIELTRKAKSGAIPDDHDPPFNLAIRDLRTLNTLVYDLHGHVVPQFDRKVAGVLIYQYTTIKTHLNMVSETLKEMHGVRTSKQFRRLEKHISALQTASFNIVGDLAHVLGYTDKEERNPGPESYTTWATFE